MFIVPDPVIGECLWDEVVEIESLEAHAAEFNSINSHIDDEENRSEYRIVAPNRMEHHTLEGELLEIFHVCDPKTRQLL